MNHSLFSAACALSLSIPALAQTPVAPTPQSPAAGQAPAAATPAARRAIVPLDPKMLYETIKQTDDVMDGSVPAANFAKDSPGKSKQPANGPTVIHARDSVYTADTHLAVFEHKVVLNNTTANIICDKLTATMRRGGPNKAPATPPPAPVGSQRKALAAPPGSKAIEHAVAEGNVQVTMDKVDDNGNITHSVGHGKKMDYDGATGRIVLYGRPDIQQGRNLCEATAESTVLTLNRDSSMEANGPHRTVITQEAAESDSTGGKTAPK